MTAKEQINNKPIIVIDIVQNPTDGEYGRVFGRGFRDDELRALIKTVLIEYDRIIDEKFKEQILTTKLQRQIRTQFTNELFK